jgi:hypothetical protein
VTKKTGFGFDDRIYLTFTQLVTTVHEPHSDTLSSSSDCTPHENHSDFQQNCQLSQRKVTTDGQSASLFWNKAPIRGLRPDLYYCQTVVQVFLCGALFLTRGRVCRLPESQSAVIILLSVCAIYILHVIKCMYIQHTQRPMSVQAQYSRSCPIISSSCYNISLVT